MSYNWEHDIDRLAKVFTAGWPNIEEDVAQEMRLAIYLNRKLSIKETKKLIYYRGIDFLRYYTRSGKRIRVEVATDQVGRRCSRIFTSWEDTFVDQLLVEQMLEGLPLPSRTFLIDYFFHGMTLKALGEERGVSLSRMSQVKRECLSLLRERFSGRV